LKKYRRKIPRICKTGKLLRRPFREEQELIFNGEHYWEINKKGYGIETIKTSIETIAQKHNFFLERDYRPFENPYHHFFVLKKA
jgi:hypothetical protein